MKGPTRQPILGSFEDIGNDIVRETTNVPMDIGGKILESLTGSTGTKQSQVSQKQTQEGGGKADGALGTMEETKDVQLKKAIARAALQQLATPVKQEPTMYEKTQEEEKQKKEVEKKQKEQQAMQELPVVRSKKRRGDLYGIQGKASSEKSRNVRQD